jgi:ketosteroid isomerase-like protein
MSGRAASDELLAAFRERFECWNRGELDEMQDMYHPDAVFDPSAIALDQRPRQGHAEMRRYWDEMYEAWAGLRMDPLDVVDLGEGRYVVPVRLWGKGQRSGVEVEQEFAFLYTLRGERIARAQMFPSEAEALAAAGAEEA